MGLYSLHIKEEILLIIYGIAITFIFTFMSLFTGQKILSFRRCTCMSEWLYIREFDEFCSRKRFHHAFRFRS